MKWFVGRFVYAFQGLCIALRDKSIFLQLIFALLTCIVCAFLRISISEWRWILTCIFLVVICEVFNSCIERCVDYISLERNPQAKKIKDLAASAVFLASVFAFIIGCTIVLPKLF